jgi:glycosyltransferase involved in cell wall biosynthesis
MTRDGNVWISPEQGSGLPVHVHMVEVGGRGGVFQHSAALAGALSEAGCRVTFHTAADAESTVPGVLFCRCVAWYRRFPRLLRRLAVTGHYLFRTLPHILRQTGHVIHIQGTFVLPLTAMTVAFCARNDAVVAFSPHNTFRRNRSPLGEAVLRATCKSANVVFAFSKADVERLSAWGVPACLTEMVFLVPQPSVESVEMWRTRLGGSPLVLMVGFVRPDKRPDLFVSAMTYLSGCHGAIVGEDHGGIDSVRQAAADAGITVVEEYLALDDFTAVVAAADVVVCPYDQASQSGLKELASISVPKGDPKALAEGIRKAIALGRQPRRAWGPEAARDTLRGYGYERPKGGGG